MAKLTVLYDNKPSRVYRIEDTISIGRDASNDIQIIDVKVSRRHSTIEKKKGYHLLKDLSSRNGTFLNGIKITETELSSGDRIRVGDSEIMFEEEPFIDLSKEDSSEMAASDTSGSQMTILDHTFELKQVIDIAKPSPDQQSVHGALAKLKTLFEVTNIINTSRDLNYLLNSILDHITRVIHADRSYLLMLDKNGELIPVAVRTHEGDNAVPQISNTILKQVLDKGNSILSPDTFQDERFKGSESIFIHSIRSAMCVPVRSRKKILGVIHVDTKGAYDTFSEDDLRLLTAIGISAGISIENLKLYEDLKRLFRSTVKSLVATIEANDQYTGGHSVRVAEFSKKIAETMGLPDDEVEIVELAAYLHDIGKVSIPGHILNKPGKFSPKEYQIMQGHPATGAEILKKIDGMEKVSLIVRHHHERYDGNGYPDGLKGDEIPLASRILCAADTLDAITTDRSYRKGRTMSEALKELSRCSNSQFDPEIIKLVKKVAMKGELTVKSANNQV